MMGRSLTPKAAIRQPARANIYAFFTQKRDGYNGRMKRLFLLLLLAGLTACRPQTPAPVDEAARVQAAAAATLTAPPPPSCPPSPTPPAAPSTPTPDLTNLFCQYEFCLGHPTETYLFDALVIREEHTASNYAYGLLMTYQANLFIQFNWSLLAGEPDPYAMLAVTAGDDIVDMDNLQVDSLSGWIVTYAPLLKTASPNVLPYGLVASWSCGDREFGWKAYTAAENQALPLLNAALERFHCTP